MEGIQFDIHNPVSLKEIPALIDKHDFNNRPIPFSIIAITCNYARNEGGEILILENVIQYRNTKIIEYGDKTIEINPSLIPTITPKLAERVRRLYNDQDDTIRNVNIRYITHFRGQNETKFRRLIY
jgi:hypothetical protein